MRRLLALILCSALVAAGCSDDDTEGVAQSGVAPTTTAAPTTTTEPAPEAATPVAVTPFVVCDDDPVVFFGYESDGTAPALLTESVLEGAIADDEPFVPTLVAPGRVSPAFYAEAAVDQVLSWTVVGPDGEPRTATAGPETPPCTDELLEPTTPDPRTPALEVTRAELSPDGASVTIDVELTGVPAISVCPDGLTAEPVSVRMDDGRFGNLVEGSSSTWTGELSDRPSGEPGQLARFLVAALVVDQCGDGEDVQPSWPNGEFRFVRDGLWACVTVVDGEISTVVSVNVCEGGLPPTGGGRIRG